VKLPSGLATVRLYWVRLLGTSVATEGAFGIVMLGLMLTAEPDPVSTNLSGSVAARVTEDALLIAASDRFVPWPEESDVAAT
jgi:hypothetical protein